MFIGFSCSAQQACGLHTAIMSGARWEQSTTGKQNNKKLDNNDNNYNSIYVVVYTAYVTVYFNANTPCLCAL